MPESDVSLLEEGVEVVEGEGFPTVDEVVPRRGKTRTNFNSLFENELEPVPSIMDDAVITTLNAKWGILDHIKTVPAGKDIVHLHCPSYCAFYAYPFIIGTRSPFLLRWWIYAISTKCARLNSLRMRTRSFLCSSSMRSWPAEEFP